MSGTRQAGKTARWKVMTRFAALMAVMLLVVSLLPSCGPAAPQIVEKEVVRTVVVEKEVPVEKKVVETVIVEKEVAVEKVVTATPLPVEQTLRIGWQGTGQQAQYVSHGKDWGRSTSMFMYASLLYIDADQELQPYLAESRESNEDATVFTFHIDPRAVWSNGDPLTAADVKAAWEFTSNINNESVNMIFTGSYLGNVKGFKEFTDGAATEIVGLVALDEKTLEIQLLAGDPLFPMQIANSYMTVFHAGEAAKDPGYFLKANPVVSGPYQLTKLDATGANGELEINPKWWGTKPAIEKIITTVFEDEEAKNIAFENGQIDLIQSANPEMGQRLVDATGGELIIFTSAGGYYHGFQAGVEPVDDINLRKALVHAVDYESIALAVWGPPGPGVATPWMNIGLKAVGCYDASLESYFEFNPEKAKEYLAASKYGSAANVPTLRMTSNTSNPQIVEGTLIIQENWRVNLGIEDVDVKPRYQDFGDDPYHVRRGSMGSNPPDPALAARNAIHSSGFPMATTMGGYEYRDASGELVIDKMVTEAYAMDRDDPKFCATINEAQKIFLEQYMMIPMWQNTQGLFGVTQPWLKGFVMTAYQIPYSFWAEPLTHLVAR